MGRAKINDGLTKYQRYYKKNKEKRNAYSKQYHVDNKESILKRKVEYDKKRRSELKHDPLVYLIVKENYVGTTENLFFRLHKHKADYNRDTSEVIILSEFKDRDDALDLERALHNEGYEGKHKFNTYK